MDPAILSEEVAILATLEFQGCKLEIKKGDIFNITPLVVKVIKLAGSTSFHFDGVDTFGFSCEVLYNFGDESNLESFGVARRDIAHNQTTKPIILPARYITQAAFERFKTQATVAK